MTRQEYDRQMRLIRLDNLTNVVCGLILGVCVLAMATPIASLIYDMPAKITAALNVGLR